MSRWYEGDRAASNSLGPVEGELVTVGDEWSVIVDDRGRAFPVRTESLTEPAARIALTVGWLSLVAGHRFRFASSGQRTEFPQRGDGLVDAQILGTKITMAMVGRLLPVVCDERGVPFDAVPSEPAGRELVDEVEA